MIKCEFEDGAKTGKLRHVVVHCLCVKDSKILLVKRSEKLLEGGKWGFPEGFLDQGEDINECAVRELMEETGYVGAVDKLFRVNSSPNRKNDNGRNNVAFEILMNLGEKKGESDWEQTAVEWVDIEKLEEDRMAFDHYKTIEDLKKYLKESGNLPIIYP